MSTVVMRIEEVSRAITTSVSLQSKATQNIAESVEGAASRTRQVADTIAGVNDFAGRTRQDAQQIMQAVADLNRQAASPRVAEHTRSVREDALFAALFGPDARHVVTARRSMAEPARTASALSWLPNALSFAHFSELTSV
jgi:hypothetical protein